MTNSTSKGQLFFKNLVNEAFRSRRSIEVDETLMWIDWKRVVIAFKLKNEFLRTKVI